MDDNALTSCRQLSLKQKQPHTYRYIYTTNGITNMKKNVKSYKVKGHV